MGTSKDNLIEKINELEKQLKEAKKHTYGDLEDEKSLVWNVESLFKDLPFLITQVVKENKKMQKMYLDLIKESLKEI